MLDLSTSQVVKLHARVLSAHADNETDLHICFVLGFLVVLGVPLTS